MKTHGHKTAQVTDAIMAAHNAACDRADCDMSPRTVEITMNHPRVIEIDVQYSTEGWQALYGYDVETGKLELYQD